MPMRLLGNTGELVSSLGLGTWAMGDSYWGPSSEKECIRAVRCAVDHGINLVDTAPVYGFGRSEEIVGKAISGIRDQVFLASKCGLRFQGKTISKSLAPASIREEIDLSLARLGTDRIDLVQCHWPDPETPIEETMAALLDIQRQGKIRFIGVSNFERPLLLAAIACGDVVSVQCQLSLLQRESLEEVLPTCKETNVGFVAYGALGGGLLTGKYDVNGPPPPIRKRDVRSFFYHYFHEPAWSKVRPLVNGVCDIAKRENYSPGVVALLWVAAQPGVSSVLVGVRNGEQMAENAQAMEVELSDAAIAELTELTF